MSVPYAAFRVLSRSAGATRLVAAHSAFLVTVSAAALVIASPSALARSLNGGGAAGTVSAPNIASDAASNAARQAAAAAQQTQQSLARAARAMQDMQDMQAVQAAARAAAAAAQVSATAPVNVPNGLGTGGLLPDMGMGRWTGANAPTQGTDGKGQTEVNIRQVTQQAILNWREFNVGARTTLTFDQQGNRDWVALNRVDATMGPSQILGNIKADGHVYVINQSGIIFGGNSQINVGSLIASTAGITDAHFRANGIFSAQSGNAWTPSFTAAGAGGVGAIAGKIFVEAGAAINTRAPSSVQSGGGYVLMIGSEVSNAGSIGTPRGQTILAAGDSFNLRRGFTTEGNAISTTRGIEIAPIIAVGATRGVVGNSGLIFAQQGDITLAGRTISQDGALIATTSVNTRGTIHLLNATADGAGSVTLNAGSITAILPELDSKDTALNGQRDALIAASVTANAQRTAHAVFNNLSLLADRQDQSRIEIVTGGNITFKGDSYTAAQGGQIAGTAGKRIFTEDGARLDVSGVRNVALTMESNNLKVNVQGNELRDSPQNRDSDVLKNSDVWIDVRTLTLVPDGTGGYSGDRYYTAGGLLEVGGYLGNTTHTIGEWTAVGGSITLSAQEVIAQAGAVFDISGGSLDYAGGWLRSTNLIGRDGRRYSVDNAPGGLTYVGYAGGYRRTHNIQGQEDERLTEIWTTVFDRGRTSLRWEDGYTVGRDAGRLNLSAPTSLIAATIVADTRMLRPRDANGHLTLADTHFSKVDRFEGGGVWYWAEGNYMDGTPGTPVPGWALDPGYNVCEVEVGQCVKVSWLWAPGNDFGGTAGTPVEEWALDPGYNVCLVVGGQCVSIGGNGVLAEVNPITPMFSVLRTGIGDLDIVTGGNIAMRSSYGVYTAGTQSRNVDTVFNAPRVTRNGSVLGDGGFDYESLVSGVDATYRAWYPELGGNLLLKAGGNLTGDAWTQGGVFGAEGSRHGQNSSADPANWLWRQGDVAGAANGAAWWINFGSYVAGRNDSNPFSENPYLVGFTGYGTLGGGDLNVDVRGGAGTIDVLSPGRVDTKLYPRSQGLVLAVASTGRVNANGELLLTGGGDMDVRIGGGINPNRFAHMEMVPGSSNPTPEHLNLGLSGLAANLRGHAAIQAGAHGSVELRYGPFAAFQDPKEVRAYDPFTSTWALAGGGLMLMPGDSTFSLTSRGDLVAGGVWDGGRLTSIDPVVRGSNPWFSLWTGRTSIDLFAAGGNLTPSIQLGEAGSAIAPNAMAGGTGGRFVYPAILRAAAPSGSIYAGASAVRQDGKPLGYSLMLAPSPYGELELLAGNSIYAGGHAITRSSADVAVVPTPFDPATMSNLSPLAFQMANNMFAFGPNTASGLYDLQPARFYALSGDIVGLRTGEVLTSFTGALNGRTLYEAGGPVWIRAGRDIVNSGTNIGQSTYVPTTGMGGSSTGNLIAHSSETDVSIVSAGRDIIFSSFYIAGPGTLEVTAARNIRQEDRGAITSLGSIIAGDNRPGASVFVAAGMADANWAAVRTRYLDRANLANPDIPLADQPGKAVKSYGKELADWLKARYGHDGSAEENLAYFDALAPEQQRIFLREIYYAELRAGGRDYNDPTSKRFGSYLRGREMIATLFPEKNADGSAIVRTGDITLFSTEYFETVYNPAIGADETLRRTRDGSVRTLFGGDIQMMAPGGQVIVGVEGVVPGATAGLVTQGKDVAPGATARHETQGIGNIQIYSQGSVLLGLSRIMTTFGGGILAWSANGDINAGRGTKSTILYTPPRRTVDMYGNVTLAPVTPSSGAGIATLQPIPEVKAGDIDLIAPLGTIDAGEAGIRVSGNINLAALQVLNAANIQVQGTSTGIPTVQAPSISAALSTSNATAANQQTAAPQASANAQPSVIIVEVLGYGGGSEERQQDEQKEDEKRKRTEQRAYDPNSAFRAVGNGKLTEEQRGKLTERERESLDKLTSQVELR